MNLMKAHIDGVITVTNIVKSSHNQTLSRQQRVYVLGMGSVAEEE